MGSEAQIEETVRRLALHGFNLLYVRTWWDSATIYPSEVVAAAGGPRQHARFVGRDPLAEAIRIGKKYGVQIAAWMEYGLALKITTGAQDPGPILRQNPAWHMVDRRGSRALVHGTGSYSYWMDPAHPGVRAFIRDMAVELVTKYPDLAVYEADRFRYPSIDWSYAPSTIERYMAETGQPDPTTGSALYVPWVEWRRAQTTRLMGEVYRAIKAANPSVVVSAAVVPPYMIDTDQDKLQHWPTWADSHYVDVMEPMLYISDGSYPTLLSRAVGLLRNKVPYYGGIQIGGNDPVFQVNETRRQGGEGVVVWYEADITDAHLSALRSGPFREDVKPPYDDLRADNSESRKFSFTGPWTALGGGYLGNVVRLATSQEGRATWTLRPARTGMYDLYARWTPASENSARARYEVEVNSEQNTRPEVTRFEVDQRGGGGWQRIGTLSLDHDDVVDVKLDGRPDGAVVADAVRLVRVSPMGIEEVLAIEPTRIFVRFNYPVSAVTAGQFSIAGLSVISARVSAHDPYVVELETSTIPQDTDLVLTAREIEGGDGRSLALSETTFRFTPSAVTRQVDDAESGFRTFGTWSARGDLAPFVGSGFRSATQNGTNRVVWTTTFAMDGRYDLEIHLPAGTPSSSERVAYIVGHSQGFDTVYVNQREYTGGWATVGTFDYRSAGTGLVTLQGSISSPGELLADAVRFRRTLVASDAGVDETPGAFAFEAVYPNPARSESRARFHFDAPGTLRLELFDALGRRVAATSTAVASGLHVEAIPLQGLASGVHFVRATFQPVAGRSRVETRSLLVIH